MDYELELRQISYLNPAEVQQVKDFLGKFDLKLDSDVEHTLAYYKDDVMVATGSVAKKVLKCIAVDPSMQGAGVSAKLLTALINYQYQNGIHHRFVFTKPKNIDMFTGLGFKIISKVDNLVTLLEAGNFSIQDFLKNIKEETKKKIPDYETKEKVGAIVVNCNPITNGHLYLIENSAAQVDVLHLFVVSEERSLFPTAIRYELIKKATTYLKNVVVHRGDDYIISSATFPAYFAKRGEETKMQTMLDITVFGDVICRELNIKKRFVGEEPYCPVTNTYNETMKELLPKFGVELSVIKRKEIHGDIISASKVRKFIKEDEFEKIKEMVPQATYEFLLSEEAEPIIKKIKESESRH